MKKVPNFKPVFHCCGDHYHLVTGPEYGASPMFTCIEAAHMILSAAAAPGSEQDRLDVERLKVELSALRIGVTPRRRLLRKKVRPGEKTAFGYWTALLRGELRGNVGALIFFQQVPCDFVEKVEGGNQLHIRPKRVNEVLALEER